MKNSKKSGMKSKKRDTTFGMKVDVPGYGKGSVEYGYKQVPVANGLRSMMGAPRVNGNKAFVVKHSEYVQDLVGTSSFSILQIPIQPGLPSSFPWLSTLAPNFEMYRIKSFNCRVETQSPTSVAGTILGVIDYDPVDAAPASKVIFMTKAGASRTAVWDRLNVSARAIDRPFTRLYIRDGGLAANLDIKTYDYGNVFIAVEGVAGTEAIAEIYVDYEIEFFTPESTGFNSVDSGSYTAGFLGSKASPFAGGPTSPSGSLPIAFPGNSNQFTIDRAGTYMITWLENGTNFSNGSVITFTPLSSNTSSSSYVLTIVSGGIIAGTSLVLGTAVSYTTLVYIYSAGDGFTVAPSGGTVTSLQIWVAPIHYNSSQPLPVRPGIQQDMVCSSSRMGCYYSDVESFYNENGENHVLLNALARTDDRSLDPEEDEDEKIRLSRRLTVKATMLSLQQRFENLAKELDNLPSAYED